MAEVVCIRIRLKPESLAKVREWARVMSERREEALATLRDEGVLVESAFLDRASDGDYLVYYMRARSLAAAKAAVAVSTHDIDRYHQEFKRETWDVRTSLELLVDLESPPAVPCSGGETPEGR
jgi:hypothetical protein